MTSTNDYTRADGARRPRLPSGQLVAAAILGAVLFAAITWMTFYLPDIALVNRIGIAVGAALAGAIMGLLLALLWRRVTG